MLIHTICQCLFYLISVSIANGSGTSWLNYHPLEYRVVHVVGVSINKPYTNHVNVVHKFRFGQLESITLLRWNFHPVVLTS